MSRRAPRQLRLAAANQRGAGRGAGPGGGGGCLKWRLRDGGAGGLSPVPAGEAPLRAGTGGGGRRRGAHRERRRQPPLLRARHRPPILGTEPPAPLRPALCAEPRVDWPAAPALLVGRAVTQSRRPLPAAGRPAGGLWRVPARPCGAGRSAAGGELGGRGFEPCGRSPGQWGQAGSRCRSWCRMARVPPVPEGLVRGNGLCPRWLGAEEQPWIGHEASRCGVRGRDAPGGPLPTSAGKGYL